MLRLSCVVHGPIYGRFMGCFVNYFFSATYKVYLICETQQENSNDEYARYMHREPTVLFVNCKWKLNKR